MNLKDVTVEEALAAIRDLYGYEYRIEGTRVFVQGAGLQTRVFQVNYLPGQRRGATEVRVQSERGERSARPRRRAPRPTPGSGSSRSLESSPRAHRAGVGFLGRPAHRAGRDRRRAPKAAR